MTAVSRKVDAMSTKSSRGANAFFKKQDEQAARSEYDERLRAEQEKCRRLRALRLAKEASDRKAAAEAAATKAAAKKPAAKRRKTVAAMDAVNA